MWIMGSSSFLHRVIMEVVGGFFFLDELTMSGGDPTFVHVAHVPSFPPI
jgi:hypothetical protein